VFQTFDDRGGPALGRALLPLLRDALARSSLDGFIVPHEDEYQNESVPPAYDRLAWLTGFTGSAGCAIVLAADGDRGLQATRGVPSRERRIEGPFRSIRSRVPARTARSFTIG
jgi:hypothetical protein